MKRDRLVPAEFYIESLEEVLGFRLDDDAVRTKDVRRRLESLAVGVRKLNEGLTRERGALLERPYLAGKDLQQAYRLYYTTTNLLKVVAPLRELAFSGLFDRDELRVLDLGTGTGAAIWGLVQFLESDRKQPIRLSVMAVDAVAENLAFVRSFAQAIARRCTNVSLSVETRQFDLERFDAASFSPESFDLVMMMNTLNELSDAAQAKLLEVAPPLLSNEGAMLIIEPASREQSRALLRLRDRAVLSGLTVYAPCTRQATCPALVKEDDWCHSEYPWKRPKFIEAIDELVGLVRLSLKSSYLTLDRDGLTLANALSATTDPLRVVSERFDEKGRVRAICCGISGRGEYTLNKRDKSIENKQFADIDRYDLIEISGCEEREHDTLVSGSSVIRPLLQATGAR